VLHGLDKLTYFGGPTGAVWNGHEVFMTGNLSLCPEKGSACGKLRAAFTAYDPATDSVRELKLPPPSASFGSDTAASLKAIAWTGTNVVLTAPTAGSTGSIRIFLYNPSTGVWQKGVAAPCYLRPAYTQSAWIGDRFVAACGSDGLQIYDPATDTWTWRTITPGPSPMNSRDGSAIVWTGTDLIAWSGSVPEPRNPTPADGTLLTLKG